MNKIYLKRILLLLLATICLFSDINLSFATTTSYSADEIKKIAESVVSSEEITAIEQAQAGISSNEWMIIALEGLEMTKNTSTYAGGIEQFIASMYQGNLNNTQPTQWYRMTLAANACKMNVKNIAGYDLIADGVYYHLKYSPIGRQGINGWAWALIALDSVGEMVPEGADYNRSSIITEILKLQHSDGSFSLMGAGDPDVTAMVLQALSPYYNSSTTFDGITVKNSIDRALIWLSNAQQPAGDYVSYGIANAESTAQVIIALVSLGIDPQTDTRFIKNDNSALDALMLYRTASGKFSHIAGDKDNGLATAQSLLALSAVYRFYSGKSFIYRFGANPSALLDLESIQEESESPVETAETTTQLETTQTESTQAESTQAEITWESTEQELISTEQTTAVQTTAGHTGESQATEEIVAATTEKATPEDTSEDTSEDISEDTSENTSIENTTIENTSIENTSFDEIIDKADKDIASSETDDNDVKRADTDAAADNSGHAKKIATIIFLIVLVGAIFVSVLKPIFRKFSVPLALIAFLAFLILNLNIQSVEDHYNSTSVAENSEIVTIRVLCDTAIANKDKLPEGLKKEAVLPDHGIILEANLKISEGETVFDLLCRATKDLRIQMEYTGDDDSAYIRGINYLYEYDCGDLSGWMYSVNGEFPNVSCGAYKLKAGDVVLWQYTCDLGRDIGNEYMGE